MEPELFSSTSDLSKATLSAPPETATTTLKPDQRSTGQTRLISSSSFFVDSFCVILLNEQFTDESDKTTQS
jgi:hypothetical protein